MKRLWWAAIPLVPTVFLSLVAEAGSEIESGNVDIRSLSPIESVPSAPPPGAPHVSSLLQPSRLHIAQNKEDLSAHDHPHSRHPANGRDEDHPGHSRDLSSSLVNNISQLDTRLIAGVNTAPSDLRTLLTPGTIVHFWASWCAPCEEEIPGLNTFYYSHIQKELGDQGIRLITISNDHAPAGAARFIKKYNLEFPVYYDAKQVSNAAVVGQRSLPSTVIVDKNGEFQRLSLGQLDWGYPKLPELLISTVTRGSIAESGAAIPQKKEP